MNRRLRRAARTFTVATLAAATGCAISGAVGYGAWAVLTASGLFDDPHYPQLIGGLSGVIVMGGMYVVLLTYDDPLG